jgi:uncharacterized protein (DUF2336 family)
MSLIDELESAIHSGSRDKRLDTLRRITDLFLLNADRFTDEQIGVFDDVLGHLIEASETKALAELSERLAPLKNAPVEVVRQLAREDEIKVAAPVLGQSARLTVGDLIDVANSKGQSHLLAISGRDLLQETVTDVLLQRGEREVFHKLAGNSGARFSENGFKALVKRSETDESLAEKVGQRPDTPLRLLRQLLSRVTETMRFRLLSLARSKSEEQMRGVLKTIEKGGVPKVRPEQAAAQRQVLAMQKNGTLDEAALVQFARTNKYPEIVAALSLLCSAPYELIERLLYGQNREAFLIPCKVADFAWASVQVILTKRSAGRSMSEHDLEQMRAGYNRLSKPSAERVLQWQVRQAALSTLK